MSVLVVAGIDPSGAAGLAMDLRVLSTLGVYATGVPTALTVQTPEKALSWQGVSGEYLRQALSAVLSGLSVKVIKIGMLGTVENVLVLSRILSEFSGTVILDPVLSASSGLPLAERDLVPAIKKELLPRVTLFTPNLPEAEAFLGRPIRRGEEPEAVRDLQALGPQAVLLKGGHAEGPRIRDFFGEGEKLRTFERDRIPVGFRGTGCFLASAVAGFLCQGLSLVEAVSRAEEFLTLGLLRAEVKGARAPEPSIFVERLSEGRRVLEALEEAAEEFCRHPVRPLIPEVQTNLAYALPLARRVEEVAAFPGRIVAYGDSARPVGCPRFGASSHVARIVLSALRFDPERRAAMNIRYTEEFLKRAEALGLRVARFSRTEEPEEVKRREGGTLSWAVTTVCRRLGFVPDLIADEGDIGKEPMIRILARTPREAVSLALRLLEIHL
ncbi:MAG TPA: bifunctional hydroxymethylpyrimidine kinase/phosphomethylpyrimidine kinase [Thermosulfurimonas dismutans]|uniref:hydroxymethylpyrimidine kinase n=1 Tax=Thermosulfurimonas dismutans TaxID=999894 RepID=A0A7C3CNU3_9BACT|nr:bifunctional hydroxymethylpyrimidine kinase/phosphomethylpyrimidine kinase [Thermosulfurimonas dismutans]